MPNITLTKAVTKYLDHLDDPTAGRDESEIAALQAVIDDEDTTTSERLAARLKLTKLEQVEPDAKMINKFIEGIQKLSENQGISLDVLKGFLEDANVPDDVLARLDGPAPVTTGRKSAADIEALVATRSDEFTVAMIVDETNASKNTVTKALKAAEENGTIVQLDGSPKRYRSAA